MSIWPKMFFQEALGKILCLTFYVEILSALDIVRVSSTCVLKERPIAQSQHSTICSRHKHATHCLVS